MVARDGVEGGVGGRGDQSQPTGTPHSCSLADASKPSAIAHTVSSASRQYLPTGYAVRRSFCEAWSPLTCIARSSISALLRSLELEKTEG